MRPVAKPFADARFLVPLPPVWSGEQGRAERTELERVTREARQALEEAVVAASVAAQRAIEVAEALDETLAVLAAAESDDNHSSSPHGAPEIDLNALSMREREVLALVAEGRSNKAIAEALFVSPNTVKTHVASLLSKLRAESRAQLAAIAARSGVVAEGTVAAR